MMTSVELVPLLLDRYSAELCNEIVSTFVFGSLVLGTSFLSSVCFHFAIAASEMFEPNRLMSPGLDDWLRLSYALIFYVDYEPLLLTNLYLCAAGLSDEMYCDGGSLPPITW